MKTNNLVILCGGKGTRIKKITRYIPKPMIKFNGIYFLQYLINFYSKYNFKKIYLLAGYKGDLIKKNFHKKRFNLVETECIIEKKPLGTAGCLNLLPKNIDSFFLINGDSYFDYNFEEFYKFCKNKDAAMLLVENKNYKSNKKLSSIKINKTKHIIYSKTNKIMNAGVYFFKKKIFQNKLTNISLENEIIPKLISNNKIYGIKLKGLFIDIGLYKNLKIANKILKKLIKPAIFLDRDGVIFKDLGYVNSLKRVIWTKSLFTTLKKLQKYLIFIVTNQAGIGRGLYTKKEFYIFQKKIKEIFIKKKIYINDVEHCPHHPTHGKGKYKKQCASRKPGNKMITDIVKRWPIIMNESFLVGDRDTDMKAANKSKLIFIKKNINKDFREVYTKINRV